jgi:AraC-like DNA-binding protein
MKKNDPKNLSSVKRKKISLLLICIAPAFLLIFPVLALSNPALVIFPASDIQNRISALNDTFMKGNSQIDGFSYDSNAIELRYTLRKGASTPLVFITTYVGSPEKPLDISQYESLTIRVREATNKRIMLFIKTFVPGISLPENKNANTLRHNQYILQLHPGVQLYTISLKEFVTPSWWIDMMKVELSRLPEESFRNVITIDMQFNIDGSDYKLDTSEKIVIENISFHRSVSIIVISILSLVMLYYLGFISITIIRKVRAGAWKLPDQRPLDVSSYREKELLRIKDFIESHYHDPNISTRMIYKVLGIPQDRVFDLLKQEYRLTFKQLINKMRIEEAKRILSNTDLRIIDIALNLGFNNISYFNNLFKSYEGISPSDFRDKNKTSKWRLKEMKKPR